MVEDVAGVQHEIDVSGEDVGDRGREAVFDVDRALVPPRFRIGFSVGGVAKMRIRQVRNPQRGVGSRGVGDALLLASRLLASHPRGHCRVRALAINF